MMFVCLLGICKPSASSYLLFKITLCSVINQICVLTMNPCWWSHVPEIKHCTSQLHDKNGVLSLCLLDDYLFMNQFGSPRPYPAEEKNAKNCYKKCF